MPWSNPTVPPFYSLFSYILSKCTSGLRFYYWSEDEKSWIFTKLQANYVARSWKCIVAVMVRRYTQDTHASCKAVLWKEKTRTYVNNELGSWDLDLRPKKKLKCRINQASLLTITHKAVFLAQRLSLAVQRSNTVSILVYNAFAAIPKNFFLHQNWKLSLFISCFFFYLSTQLAIFKLLYIIKYNIVGSIYHTFNKDALLTL